MTDVTRKVVSRYLTATGVENFGVLVGDALRVHEQLQRWLQHFPQELRKALEASSQLAHGRVWAKLISDLWDAQGGYKDAQRRFHELKEAFDDIYLAYTYLDVEANLCLDAVHVPKEAQIEVVMASVGFEKEPPPGAGPTWALSYDVEVVERWVKNLLSWSVKSEHALKKALQLGQRKIKRKTR